MDCQYIKDGYVVKGKINIYNNVPKPSLLANKLLEKSKKFISDYNGFNEEEKRRKSKRICNKRFKVNYWR